MSLKQNDILLEAKEIEMSEWLKNVGASLTDVQKGLFGFFVVLPARSCTDQQGTCESGQKCECKEKVFLPESLQHI